MRVIVHSAAALGILSLAVAATLGQPSDAFAQAPKQAPPAKQAPAQGAPAQAAPPPAAQQQPPQMKQIALTDKQLDGVIASQKDFDAILSKVPPNSDKPDPKVLAQLDDVAKKNGFADYNDYNVVVDNISLVFAGFDPKTKSYVGPEGVIKSQIAAVQADKKMPAKDKKQALDDLNAALKTPAPAIENKGNIELVGKYYDKLVAMMQDSE